MVMKACRLHGPSVEPAGQAVAGLQSQRSEARSVAQGAPGEDVHQVEARRVTGLQDTSSLLRADVASLSQRGLLGPGRVRVYR